GVTGVDLTVPRARPVGCQQADAVVLDAPVGAKRQSAFGNRPGFVVEDRRAWVPEFGCAPARPWQSVVLTLARPRFGAQRRGVEGVLVLHLPLEPLGRATRVAD